MGDTLHTWVNESVVYGSATQGPAFASMVGLESCTHRTFYSGADSVSVSSYGKAPALTTWIDS